MVKNSEAEGAIWTCVTLIARKCFCRPPAPYQRLEHSGATYDVTTAPPLLLADEINDPEERLSHLRRRFIRIQINWFACCEFKCPYARQAIISPCRTILFQPAVKLQLFRLPYCTTSPVQPQWRLRVMQNWNQLFGLRPRLFQHAVLPRQNYAPWSHDMPPKHSLKSLLWLWSSPKRTNLQSEWRIFLASQ